MDGPSEELTTSLLEEVFDAVDSQTEALNTSYPRLYERAASLLTEERNKGCDAAHGMRQNKSPAVSSEWKVDRISSSLHEDKTNELAEDGPFRDGENKEWITSKNYFSSPKPYEYFADGTPKNGKKWSELESVNGVLKSRIYSVGIAKVSPNSQHAMVDQALHMHIINPKVSTLALREKMIGRESVSVLKIKTFLETRDVNNVNWVTGGAIVGKVVAVSKNGNPYCRWTLSDLKGDIKMVTVILFGTACKEHMNLPVGTVVGILNPLVLPNENIKTEATLRVCNADRIMVIGTSKDYGTCRSKRQDGKKCKVVVNKSSCEYCVFHLKKEYDKTKRGSQWKESFTVRGRTSLRNKILGRNEVFYGGKSYTAKNGKDVQKNLKEKEKIKTSAPLSSGTSKATKEQEPPKRLSSEKCNSSKPSKTEVKRNSATQSSNTYLAKSAQELRQRLNRESSQATKMERNSEGSSPDRSVDEKAEEFRELLQGDNQSKNSQPTATKMERNFARRVSNTSKATRDQELSQRLNRKNRYNSSLPNSTRVERSSASRSPNTQKGARDQERNERLKSEKRYKHSQPTSTKMEKNSLSQSSNTSKATRDQERPQRSHSEKPYDSSRPTSTRVERSSASRSQHTPKEARDQGRNERLNREKRYKRSEPTSTKVERSPGSQSPNTSKGTIDQQRLQRLNRENRCNDFQATSTKVERSSASQSSHTSMDKNAQELRQKLNTENRNDNLQPISTKVERSSVSQSSHTSRAIRDKELLQRLNKENRNNDSQPTSTKVERNPANLKSVETINSPKQNSDKLISFNIPVTREQMMRNRANAIRIIREKGPLKKSEDDIRKKKTPEQIEVIKRKIEEQQKEREEVEKKRAKTSENHQNTPKSLLQQKMEKVGITEKFLEVMNSQPENPELLKEAESEEREKYFQRLEIKEKMEDKMASTFRVTCRAVRCVKCNYRNFAASDFCKKENHPMRVINVVKRFWKCGDCGTRTISLDVVPIIGCKACGGSRWERTSMLPEKKAQVLPEQTLSIRGHEETFFGSVVKNPNINLLVPDE